MRWVLIRPLNRSLFYDPEVQEPLGLEYLAATLNECGCKVLVLDSAMDQLEDKKLARRAMSFQPDAIGFSITTDRELESVQAIYQECKALPGEKKICWFAGGNYVTTESNHALRDLPQDLRLLKYDGELFVRQVCALWKEGLTDTLPRLTNGEPPTQLNELPFPIRPYHQFLNNHGWAFNMQGARGCCGACRYCASRGMRSPKLTTWRGKSPEYIVNEIAYLYNVYSARTFNFVDEDFLGPPLTSLQRAKDIAERINTHGLKITFGIQIRPNSLSKEIIDVLAAAGLKYVFMGIESDNPNDFKAWGRSFCNQTWQWVEYLQKKDIEVNAGTLLFQPDSTFEGVRSFATALQEHGLLNYRTAVNRLDAMPGSSMYEQYIAENPGEQPSGMLSLPFKHPKMETFYQAVLKALAPIEIPSMHALCEMPTIQTHRMFGKGEKEYICLKSINSECDDQVSVCFFSLLNRYEKGECSEAFISKLEEENYVFANAMTKRLAENGFLASTIPEVQNLKHQT